MQALGRCIRHKSDYGAIILLDERLRSLNIQRNLSRWLRGQIYLSTSSHEACKSLTSFFQSRQEVKQEPSKANILTLKEEQLHDATANSEACKPAPDIAATRDRWAHSPKINQLTIAQAFATVPLRKVKQEPGMDDPRLEGDSPALQHGACRELAADRSTLSTQPCGGPPACSARAANSASMEHCRSAARATQPTDSISFGTWERPHLYTRALELLKSSPSCTVEALNDTGDAANGSSVCLNMQMVSNPMPAAAPTCCTPIGKRPRDEIQCSDPCKLLQATPCAGDAQGEYEVMLTQPSSRVVKGGGCQIDPEDAQFLRSMFLDDDDDADADDMDDAHAGMHTNDSGPN